MDWLFLFIGGLCEIGFVIMMKLSDGFKKKQYTILTILFVTASLYMLSLSLKTIPIAIGYAVWTGIGGVGSVIVGILLFDEPKSLAKIIFTGMILCGIVGLRLSTHSS